MPIKKYKTKNEEIHENLLQM